MQRKRTMQAAGILLAAALCLIGLYLLRPPCLILQYTGFACAGCGTQRMIGALLRGDIAGAFFHNPFMFLLLPPACAYALWEAYRYARGKSPLYKRKGARIAAAAVLVAAVVFTVLRNLPGVTVLGP